MRPFVVLMLVFCSHLLAAQVNFQDFSMGNPIYNTKDARGAAIGDYDNDGDDDILVAADPIRLYKNNGNFSFSEVAQGSGINFTATLVTWFDADDDGWLDFLAGTFWQLRFYKNQGDGTFTDATATSGFFAASNQAFLIGDLNGDQHLDVYSNNLSKWNQLFINNGDGTFVDRVVGSGAEWSSMAMGGILFDIDKDRDQDIFIVFDGKNPDQLFLNDGVGNFTSHAEAIGLDVRSEAMGVDFADFNHDGRYDVYITNLFDNNLMIQQPDGSFMDSGVASGTNDKGMGWGTFCFDYNNDTFSDIYVINSYGFNNYPNVFYKNNGDNTFTNIAAGTNLELKLDGYGGAYGDFDSDGKPDIVVANFNDDGVKLFRNNEASVGNWIELNLVGTLSNKFAVGSVIEIHLENTVLFDEVTVGSGYKSQNTYRVHVGVGTATIIDELVIKWPDGSVNSYSNIGVNARYLAIENETLTPFNAENYKQALTRPSQLADPPDLGDPDPRQETGHSVARLWNEALLNCIRNDFARPTVHARNLFHFSAALYDAWAAFDEKATTYFLGKSHGEIFIPFDGVTIPDNVQIAREEAISFAAFRLLLHRFNTSPGAGRSLSSVKKLFASLGYDETFTSTNYTTGSSAALGNYLASKIIEFGLIDNSNEGDSYRNKFYEPVNPSFNPKNPGVGEMTDPNRWQPITLDVAIDQNGNVVQNTPPFLSPEWGAVVPFALTSNEVSVKTRDGDTYHVYHDPGGPPKLNVADGSGLSEEYIWNFMLVSVWASHLDPTDGVMIDASPASIGNISDEQYPTTIEELRSFYDLENGGDIGTGYEVNPKTGLPYAPQLVPRGDYARVLAEFWADGPSSETPPGHWYSILNYVNDHPQFEKKFMGVGEPLDDLEWDVKAYFVLGGGLHDAAVTAWGIKGYYDGVRPVSAIRSLGMRGQSSNPSLPNYHPAGIKLMEGFIELVQPADPLAGKTGEHVNKIKLYTWRGPTYIDDPATTMSGVGWILAENWWPYQRPTFVSPPFAGYISGHSTYSRTAAEIMTMLTGDEYFPGGMSEFHAKQNEYLVFEEGPSQDVVLQWAKYKDASDQCSLSRIWGGIHPPFDDIPGRLIGMKLGKNAFELASKYFEGLITQAEDERPVTSLTVYPNPAHSGSITVSLGSLQGNARILLTDFTGKSYSASYIRNGNSLLVDISTFQDGVYMLAVQTATSFFHHKVLIKRN